MFDRDRLEEVIGNFENNRYFYQRIWYFFVGEPEGIKALRQIAIKSKTNPTNMFTEEQIYQIAITFLTHPKLRMYDTDLFILSGRYPIHLMDVVHLLEDAKVLTIENLSFCLNDLNREPPYYSPHKTILFTYLCGLKYNHLLTKDNFIQLKKYYPILDYENGDSSFHVLMTQPELEQIFSICEKYQTNTNEARFHLDTLSLIKPPNSICWNEAKKEATQEFFENSDQFINQKLGLNENITESEETFEQTIKPIQDWLKPANRETSKSEFEEIPLSPLISNKLR